MTCSSLKLTRKGSGDRYKMEGPPRSDEQETFQDLYYIRSCSEGEVTLAAKELRDQAKADAQATKLAAKAAAKDQDEAKAATRGYIKAVGADSNLARIHYR